MRKAIVLVSVLALAVPPHASAADMRVRAYVGSRAVYGTGGGFVLVTCHTDASVSDDTRLNPPLAQPTEVTSWCAVDGDRTGQLVVQDRPLAATSPVTSAGPKAMSFRASAFELPVTVCAGGSAVFTEMHEGAVRLHYAEAAPTCEVLT